MRGFFSGIIVGLVVTGGGLAALSLATMPPAPRPVVGSEAPAAAPAVPEAPAESMAATGDAARQGDPDLADAGPVSPDGASATGDSAALPDPGPAVRPEVAAAPSAPEAPAEGGEAAVEPGAAQPVETPEPATVPAAPDPDRSAGADTAARAPATLGETPTIGEAGSTGSDPEVAAGTDSAPATGAVEPVSQPEEESAPDVATAPAEPPAPEPVAEAPQVIVPKPEVSRTLPVITGETAPEPAAETPQQEASAAESGGGLAPSIGQPVRPLVELGGEQPTESAEAAPVAQKPLDRFAVSFENPDNKPLMSIVLIDDARSFGIEALQDFPYPLTIAINPLASDAVARMARLRAAGFEIVAVVDLPEAATARDAEVLLAASLERLDEAVGVLEGPGSGIQGNRALSDQVTDFVGASGLGLITQGNGLNTVQKLAVKDGVPAVPVFRDFDGAGQTPTVMRRFLDQAAFRARQEGGVVMLGRVRPDTISALLLWGLQDRASQVALAPVSAVLRSSVAAR